MKSLHLLSQMLPVVLMSGVMTTPAISNTFHGVYMAQSLNVGSAPNPTPEDIRKHRQGLVYPLESQMLNEEGTVGLKISLTERGTMSNVVVESSSGFPRLDNAALKYAKTNWQYKPTEAGLPVPAAVQVNVTFDMP